MVWLRIPLQMTVCKQKFKWMWTEWEWTWGCWPCFTVMWSLAYVYKADVCRKYTHVSLFALIRCSTKKVGCVQGFYKAASCRHLNFIPYFTSFHGPLMLLLQSSFFITLSVFVCISLVSTHNMHLAQGPVATKACTRIKTTRPLFILVLAVCNGVHFQFYELSAVFP